MDPLPSDYNDLQNWNKAGRMLLGTWLGFSKEVSLNGWCFIYICKPQMGKYNLSVSPASKNMKPSGIRGLNIQFVPAIR